jgi:ABC-type oligopeptide transport system substrate-binding subunit
MYVFGTAGDHDKAMVAMWQQNLGVTVNIEEIKEIKDWLARTRNKELQLLVEGWRADYVDPQNFLEVLFDSQSDHNSFAYANADVDAALKAAASETDAAARIRKYQEIEKIILADLPIAPFYVSAKHHELIKPYVKGYKLYPIGVNQWTNISLAAR